jgi:hypothetical protein
VSELKNNRYEILDRIGHGGMGAVYKVVDLLTQRTIALKEVLASKENLSFSADQTKSLTTENLAQALSQEFRVLATLRHPNIVSVIDYGFDEKQQPYLTMHYVEQARKITDFAKEQSKENKGRLIVQLLQALAYLHRRGIIHRDLKPENVLVNAEGDVKVLDFGLALSSEYAKSAGLAGTLAYVAPEVLLGNAPSIAADLYAVGVMMYEIFVGDHPFDTSNTTKLIQSILYEPPPTSALDDDLQVLLGKLLAKDPLDRSTNIDFLIAEVSALTGYQRPRETLAIRESFLQAASFIGREPELETLHSHLEKLKVHQGSAILIAGESGVGKSRLINEFRVRALVENVRVVSGQAISEAASAFKVWNDALRLLVVSSPLSDDEAMILKEIIPNIETLLRKPVADAPFAQASARRERLFRTVRAILKRQSMPLVIILEDIHWADQGSIDLFQYLIAELRQSPVMLLASFRSDEMPSLATDISRAELLRLQVFDDNEMKSLVKSAIGEFGDNPQILGFLHRETEGNAFFVVELLRTWSESVDELRQLANQPIPQEIVAGGIIAVLRRRIERLPETALPVLNLAAVFGRSIDTKLLSSQFSDFDMEAWLSQGAEFSIFNVENDQWRFAHDKLREYLVNGLKQNDSEWRKQNRLAATLIESVYKDQINEHIPALAYHWSEAKEAEKAVPYLEKAAEASLFSDYQKSIDHIKKIQSFDAHLPAATKTQHGKRQSILGNSYYGLGNYLEARKAFEAFLKHEFAFSVPENNLQLGLSLVSQLFRQMLHRGLPKVFTAKQNRPHFDSSMYFALLNSQVVYQNLGDSLRFLLTFLFTLNQMEALKPRQDINAAQSYATMTVIAGVMKLESVAQNYYRLAESIMPQIDETSQMLTRTLFGFYHFQQADWESAIPLLSKGVDALEKMGELHTTDETAAVLLRAYFFTGQSEKMHSLLNRSYPRSVERDDQTVRFPLFMVYSSANLHNGTLFNSDWVDFSILMDGDKPKIFEKVFALNPLNFPMYEALRASYQLHLGNEAEVYQVLKETIPLVLKAELGRDFAFFELYALLLQLTICLLNTPSFELDTEDSQTLLQNAEQLAKQLKQFAEIFKYAQPRANLLEGHLELLKRENGITTESRHQECFQAALQKATELKMPYEQAQSYAAFAKAGETQYSRLLDELLEELAVDANATRFLSMN